MRDKIFPRLSKRDMELQSASKELAGILLDWTNKYQLSTTEELTILSSFTHRCVSALARGEREENGK